MSRLISLSSWAHQHHYGDIAALEMISAAGFDGVDFTVVGYGAGKKPDLYAMSDDEFTEYFTSVKKRADELGLAIQQTHNLVYAYTPDEERNKKLLKDCELGLKANAILGSPVTVIHSIGSGAWGYESCPDEEMHRQNQRMYNDIIPVAEKYGITIALESFGSIKKPDGTMGYDTFADPVKMRHELDSLKTDNKCFCLDSGHTHAATSGGYMSVPEYIRYFGERIKILHLHDNDGIYDQHLYPTQGTIKWGEVFDALDEIGYNGYYNYEVSIKFGRYLKEATDLLGKFLRDFTDRCGR